ncbi:hypothetical protein F0344_32695 [Streptomyces finlayi]|uniref:Uncharacterized protein n=1 Tax=Streptomyces finlayi TaxID=67296 RepID=A0A7G7BTR5_9ACTN|nr:DUF6332 family protein [Streptomyces finlayi]QNE78730.1 hypothetical protein F0344_32695 [Streptomyces finlayi]
MGRRSQQDRDAITVEIGYALVSASFVAAAGFAGITAPALVLDLSDTAGRVLTAVGGTVAAFAFVARLVHVLWRFPRRPDGPPPPSQPSRTGRTSPDS